MTPPAAGRRKSPETIGDRIRQYRTQKGWSLSRLADTAQVSKGYLHALENDRQGRRPGAETLYAIATALGVTMSDLMGRKLVGPQRPQIPPSLQRFADQANLPEADIDMLASIQFRGEAPRTPERWQYIYTAIRTSSSMDPPTKRR